jgi:hypothetical protein
MESVLKLFNWGFWSLVFVLALLNGIYVHPGIGVGLLILSFIYVPPINERVKESTGVVVPPIAKILLGMVIIWVAMVATEVLDRVGVGI